MSGPRDGGPALVDAARTTAAQCVASVLDDGAWASPTLSAALSQSAMSARDKAFCTELVYGALRFALPLEQSLLRAATRPQKGLDARMRPHLLVAAYQLQHLSDRIPAHAAVSAAVSAIKRERKGLEGFANALLRHLGSPLSAMLTPSSSLTEVCAAYGVPERLGRAITAGLPVAEHHAAIGGLKARPRTWAIALGDPPDGADAHAFVPRAFALDGGKVPDAAGFADGAIIVLDPGSALAALAATAPTGARVIDLCAAPGGKSMLLADAVGPAGRVTAVELNGRRAVRITENAARLGLSDRVTVVVENALDLDEANHGGADVVVLDAPCTGLGATRRKPEIALRFKGEDVAKSVALQKKLLEKAARLVRPGGTLIYSVCSPLPEEGPQQVETLLAAQPTFARASLGEALPFLPPSTLDVHGQARLSPHRDDTDAIFVARLRRA